MKAGKGLLVAFVISSLFWIAVGLVVYHFSSRPSSEGMKELARLALSASADDVQRKEVIEVGDPDSVFGKCFISMDECDLICESMSRTTDSILNRKDKSFDELMADPKVASIMQRHMDAYDVVRSNSFAERGGFSAWRVRVRYRGVNSDSVPLVNDFYAVIDRSGRFVINSFEIPVL